MYFFRLDVTELNRTPFGSLACLAVVAALSTVAYGASAVRHYDFEQGTVGDPAITAVDIVDELFFDSDSTNVFPNGHLWIEVAGSTGRPIPAGNLVDSVINSALIAPALEPRQEMALYVDVSNGTPMDSPAVGSQLALSFDGDTFYDDANTGSGSRGVYIDRVAFANDDVVEKLMGGIGNTSESFNFLAQAWVNPSSTGINIPQTVWQSGTEQGSVNITDTGFWEFRDLGSVGTLNPEIPVDFDTWTHIGVYRGGNGAEIYINGELVAGNRNPTPPNFFQAFSSLITLGGTADSSSGFVGLVDDFKVMGTTDAVAIDPALDMDFWAVETTDTPCDFNADGTCDIVDLNGLLFGGQAQQTLDPYDLNNDGVVNLADRDTWLASASAENGIEIVPGDTNLDGMVVAGDLNNLGTNWLRTDATSVAQGDFNGDGNVDATDLNQVGLFWQHGAPAAAAVPEPSGCLALVATMAIWFGASRRRFA